MPIERTLLGKVNEIFETWKTHYLNEKNSGLLNNGIVTTNKNYIAFLSIGNPDKRAHVFKEITSNYSNLFENLHNKTMHMIRNGNINPQWMKIDIVNHVEEIEFSSLEEQLKKVRKNYFRRGISFDADFRLAFLEQEINGNAMISSVNKGPRQLNEKNINHYLNSNRKMNFPFIKNKYKNKSVYLFETIGAFSDLNDNKVYELHSGGLENGIRKIDNIAEETKQLIEKSTYYLVDQVKENGKFEYGYFPVFAREIGTYNILRHSSTLYSMAEGYEVIKDNRVIEAVKKGIDYLIQEAIVYKDVAGKNVAFVVDHANKSEIKLGANAAAILAMTKYMEVTGTHTYLKMAQSLARGIIEMKTLSGGFVHVLAYPSFEIKDVFRIIYYDGEAVLALLRLYAIDKEALWLDVAKQTFDYFIENDYWKHHDHWLSYAANEITIYEPEDKYFTFGLKNCHDHLKFIYQRETAFPTFLELTMATYKMIVTIKQLDKAYLLTSFNESLLRETIDHRAEFQRVGFFYPEMAMYKKRPGLILNGFFMRHHSFRVRIDDVEHYLSGYCQYLHNRIPNIK